jgi:hypothetical protein
VRLTGHAIIEDIFCDSIRDCKDSVDIFHRSTVVEDDVVGRENTRMTSPSRWCCSWITRDRF